MKKNLISIIILALLIVNIVLTAIMMFSVTTTNRKTAALVGDIASAISLDLGTGENGEQEEEIVPMADVVTYTIADMTIPLKKGPHGGAGWQSLSGGIRKRRADCGGQPFQADSARRREGREYYRDCGGTELYRFLQSGENPRTERGADGLWLRHGRGFLPDGIPECAEVGF